MRIEDFERDQRLRIIERKIEFVYRYIREKMLQPADSPRCDRRLGLNDRRTCLVARSTLFGRRSARMSRRADAQGNIQLLVPDRLERRSFSCRSVARALTGRRVILRRASCQEYAVYYSAANNDRRKTIATAWYLITSLGPVDFYRRRKGDERRADAQRSIQVFTPDRPERRMRLCVSYRTSRDPRVRALERRKPKWPKNSTAVP